MLHYWPHFQSITLTVLSSWRAGHVPSNRREKEKLSAAIIGHDFFSVPEMFSHPVSTQGLQPLHDANRWLQLHRPVNYLHDTNSAYARIFCLQKSQQKYVTSRSQPNKLNTYNPNNLTLLLNYAHYWYYIQETYKIVTGKCVAPSLSKERTYVTRDVKRASINRYLNLKAMIDFASR